MAQGALCRRALVVVGKPPIVGQVKTRLCPPLTPVGAAALHSAFLHDTVTLAATVPETDVMILYPLLPDAERLLGAVVGPGVRLLPQSGVGLGAALPGAVDLLLGEGYAQVALISSDNPNLPAGYVAMAFAALTDHDVALGPADDGGYYLIALRSAQPGLFERITWSTASVFDETCARAAEHGLHLARLPGWYDVDDIAGLRRLYTDVCTAGPDSAPATHAVFQTSFPTGFPADDGR
jgi:hypothetical protein